MEALKHQDLTEQIIKCFYKVYNTLGYGFLERVYENALVIELKRVGLSTVRQHPVRVYYEGEVVGDYCADAHEAQLLNYLRSTGIEVGLLLNFGPKPEFRRKIFSNLR